jgi:hypothetical protein
MPELDASLIIAIGGLLTGILAFISSRAVDKRAAKREELLVRKDEISLLREEVERLQKRVDELTCDNENWRKSYDRLYQYVLVLRKVLIDNKLDVPNMPSFDGADNDPDANSHPPAIKLTTRKK